MEPTPSSPSLDSSTLEKVASPRLPSLDSVTLEMIPSPRSMSPDSVMLEKVDSPRSPSRELPTDDNDHLTTTPQSAPPPNQSNDNNDQSFLLNERLTATELVKWAHIEGLNSFSRLPLVSTLVFTAAPTLPPNCHPFGLRVGNILRDGTDQHAWACVENPSRVRYFLLNARGRYIWISRNLRSSISSLPPFSTLMNDWDMLASLVAYYFVAGGTLAAFERVRRVKGTVDLDKLKMACESHAVALDEGAVSYPRVQEDDGVDRAEEGEQEEEQGKTGRKRGLEQNDSGASGSPEGRSKRSRRHVESTSSVDVTARVMQDTCKATIARAKELCDVLSDCEDGGKCKGCGTEAKAFKEYMREMWVDDE